MKRCPSCKTTYTDNTLSYCLADGKPLDDIPDEEPTVVRAARHDAMRVDIPAVSEPTVAVTPNPAASSPGRSSTKLVVLVIVGILLAVAAIAALGLAGAAFYYSSGPTVTNSNIPIKYATPTPRMTATATPTPDTENKKLKDEIANIQKQLDERNNNSETRNGDDDVERGSAVTATVDSPKDGFLALRSEPDADGGERIAKIPHGAEVEIQNCEKNTVTIGNRTGRWCQVEYNGQNGWVFDAWLQY